METDSQSLIQRLVETPGPSGYESQVRQLIQENIQGYTQELEVDRLGNLIARIGPSNPEEKKIMLVAHMDEIGIIVTHIDEKGFARFIPIGGVPARHCPGSRVRFLDGVIGIIGTERLEDPKKTPSFEQMFIDVGAAHAKECPLHVGDVGVFDRPFTILGKRLASKAMDDRIGVAILIEVLRDLAPRSASLPHKLSFVFSVQEEVGLRGATASAFGINPDLGLAVDVTSTGDTPNIPKKEVSLGNGPAILGRDGYMIADPRVVDWMISIAKKARIPYQLQIDERGGTDARAIQLTRGGVPAGTLSIPCRYLHSQSEVIDMDDFRNAIRLLVELLTHPAPLP